MSAEQAATPEADQSVTGAPKDKSIRARTITSRDLSVLTSEDPDFPKVGRVVLLFFWCSVLLSIVALVTVEDIYARFLTFFETVSSLAADLL